MLIKGGEVNSSLCALPNIRAALVELVFFEVEWIAAVETEALLASLWGNARAEG